MIGRAFLAFALSLALLAACGPASAQTCTAQDFGAVVDQTAQALRDLNGSGSKRYQAKIAALREKHHLSQDEIDARTTGLQDEKIDAFNREIEALVAQMDVLSQTPNAKITCEKLDELKRVRDRLLTSMGQKSGYMLAKIESELDGPGPVAAQAQAPAATVTQVPAAPPTAITPPARTAATPAPEQVPAAPAKPAAIAEAKPRPAEPKPLAESKPAAESKPQSLASARSALERMPPERAAVPDYAPPPSLPERSPGPSRPPRNTGPAERDNPPSNDLDRPTALAPPPYSDRLPPPGGRDERFAPPPHDLPRSAEDTVYSITEIREAGRGVFGTITAEFAGAINYAFQQFGQPNAYITGVEGGAAFLAGLRYGKGTIYRKALGPSEIFWQGPSAGIDFGAEGSRALFLVYNLDDPNAIYGRFSGIGGNAYVAGGVGLNVLGKGGVIMVPIRSGLGLRLGANLAYVKFTERQTWNPF